jgi:uncharacterized protein YidB (DUF937 family)
MGLLDMIKRVSGSAINDTASQNVISSIYELINSSHIGGVEGLVNRLSSSGLGHIADSWISTGKNKSITSTQLNNVLGSDAVNQFAGKLELPAKDALSKLTRYLPLIVDKLTPDGKVSTSNQMNLQNILDGLMKN